MVSNRKQRVPVLDRRRDGAKPFLLGGRHANSGSRTRVYPPATLGRSALNKYRGDASQKKMRDEMQGGRECIMLSPVGLSLACARARVRACGCLAAAVGRARAHVSRAASAVHWSEYRRTVDDDLVMRNDRRTPWLRLRIAGEQKKRDARG